MKNEETKFGLRHLAGPMLAGEMTFAGWRHQPYMIVIIGVLLLGNYICHWSPKAKQ